MTVAAPARRPLVTPGMGVLLAAAAAAWVALFAWPSGNTNGAAGFLPAWALMMAAMMLPAVAPVASMYARTVRTARARRLGSFAAGYLVVWALSAIPAYAGSLGVQHLVVPHPLAARIVAAGIFAACGTYQLTGLKERCLRHCRSPLAQLMRYASYGGRVRELRVGIHHAAYCVGCCWALMLLLFVFGTMSLPTALALSLLVVAEKLAPWGRQVSRFTGYAALALAGAALFAPSLAPGLHPMPMGSM